MLDITLSGSLTHLLSCVSRVYKYSMESGATALSVLCACVLAQGFGELLGRPMGGGILIILRVFRCQMLLCFAKFETM